MKSDKYGNPIFHESDIFDLIYQEIPIDKLSQNIIVEDLDNFQAHAGIQFLINSKQELSIDQFDKLSQSNWFMPEEYKQFDIEAYLVQACPTENYQRIIDELEEYRSRNMLDLLCWLKYLVDTMREKNIVWGVGRGSSVASYVLFLIGVHKIDSVKYKLDFKEFMR
jgi:DNA polymerase III alpha subunit